MTKYDIEDLSYQAGDSFREARISDDADRRSMIIGLGSLAGMILGVGLVYVDSSNQQLNEACHNYGSFIATISGVAGLVGEIINNRVRREALSSLESIPSVIPDDCSNYS